MTTAPLRILPIRVRKLDRLRLVEPANQTGAEAPLGQLGRHRFRRFDRSSRILDRQAIGTVRQHAAGSDQVGGSTTRHAIGDDLASASVDHLHRVRHGAATLLVLGTAQASDAFRIDRLDRLQRIVVMRAGSVQRDVELLADFVAHLAPEIASRQFSSQKRSQMGGKTGNSVSANTLHFQTLFLCIARLVGGLCVVLRMSVL